MVSGKIAETNVPAVIAQMGRKPRAIGFCNLSVRAKRTVDDESELRTMSLQNRSYIEHAYGIPERHARIRRVLILAFWSGPAVAVNFGPPGRVLARLRG